MNLDPIDQIKMYLRRDRHRIWGFVVYRCTYSSDEDWVRFMDILRQENRKALSYEEGGLEMWESLDMTVFEDRSTLDGASKGFVREQFREWCKSAPQQEQGAEAEAGCSQRYRYCLQVDEASLRSVVDALPRGGPYQQGFVNLINKEREHRWVGPVAGDYPEIEGSTEADTGWYGVDFQISHPITLRR